MQTSLAVQEGILLDPLAITVITVLGTVIHIFYLLFNAGMVWSLKLGGEHHDLGESSSAKKAYNCFTSISIEQSTCSLGTN